MSIAAAVPAAACALVIGSSIACRARAARQPCREALTPAGRRDAELSRKVCNRPDYNRVKPTPAPFRRRPVAILRECLMTRRIRVVSLFVFLAGTALVAGE